MRNGNSNGHNSSQSKDMSFNNGSPDNSRANLMPGMNGTASLNMSNSMKQANGMKQIHTKVAKNASNKMFGLKELKMDGLGLDSPGRSDDEKKEQDLLHSDRQTKSKKSLKESPFKKTSMTNTNLLMQKVFQRMGGAIEDQFNVKNTRPGQQIKRGTEYRGHIDENDYPVTRLDSQDYAKRLRFEQLKRTRLDAMCNWKKKDVIGLKKNTYIKEIQKKNENILVISDKNDLEKLEVATDRFPLLGCRKAIRRVFILIQMTSEAIIETEWFNNLTIFVILANSVVMMTDNPLEEPPPPKQLINDIFSYFYMVECSLKIIGMGLILNDGAYLRDSANMLDFSVVAFSVVEKLSTQPAAQGEKQEVGVRNNSGGGTDLQSLRTFRVMRPLRTISSVKGLRILMSAMISALPLLSNTIIILMFFFIMMAIAGSQLLKGELKNRCVAIQTGKLQDDDLPLCSWAQPCPGGYFCGKSAENPNYGVTNFDNLPYAFLTVFQCVTLEGWSDIMVMVWRGFSPYMFMYFILVVLLGAFFLLNLTLAVINSSFAQARQEQEAKDKVEQTSAEQGGKDGQLRDKEVENALSKKDHYSMAQYITAKIYIKKMKEFLRMRKEIKRIEEERLAKLKKKQEEVIKAKRMVQPMNLSDSSMNRVPNGLSTSPNGNGKLSKKNSGSHGRKNSNQIIMEDEEGEDQHEEVDPHLQNVQKLVKQAQITLQKHGQNTQDIVMPKKLNKNGNGNAGFNNLAVQAQGTGGPTMKGIIGRTNNNQMISANDKQKKLFSKLANEYDIDKIIPKDERQSKPAPSAKGNAGEQLERQDSGYSLGSHLKNYEIFSDKDSIGGQKQSNANRTDSQKKKIEPQDQQDGEESGLITSDSDFEAAAQAAGYQHDNFSNAPGNSTVKNLELNIKKDIAKTFRKMLTQNHNRTTQLSMKQSNGKGDNDSTKYGGSNAPGQEFDNTTQISEIELKFQKKKNNMRNLIQNKMYKEDEALEQTHLQDQFPKNGNEFDRMLKTKKEDIRQLEEFISTKKPKDPFKEMNALVEKVEIKKGVQYQGASVGEIFERRTEQKILQFHKDKNCFLQLPPQYRDDVDPDFDKEGFVKQANLPYQKKIEYEYYPDSSDLELSVSENEDDLAAKEQPFQTATMVGFRPSLIQLHNEEFCKRSDIVITSTLSMNLFPKDKRVINTKYRAYFDNEQLTEYIDQKAAFLSLYKETQFAQHKIRNKDMVFRGNYLKSFVHRQEFQTDTLKKFKDTTKKLNSNVKIKIPKTAEVLKQEQLKHMRNKRACEGRGQPMLDLETANRFLDGKYHDQSEEEEGDGEEMDEAALKQKNQEEFEKMQQEFQSAASRILADHQGSDEDEIPDLLRGELNLPKQMNFFEINFNAVRSKDAQMKRIRPMWSGQDVLPDNLDASKSSDIISQMNFIRVWPSGISGLWKRIRFVLRAFIKGSFFESFLTICVLMNTVVLALEGADTPAETQAVLDLMNIYFTWIFIVEMGLRLIAIGVGKYAAERMNLLDGFVVILSIVEMVIEAVLTSDSGEGGAPNLKAFKSLRTLRTFRVFRIARLLRMMKSMQQILQVLVRSFSNFFYITILMFIWIFIFALLGMSIYGGKQNYVEGVPRMNFDSFVGAIASAFQILTLENWQVILFELMRNDEISKWLITAYLVAWIFLGNFILLNLFLSVLLEAFLEEDEEELDYKQVQLLMEQKKKRKLKKKQREQRRKVIMAGIKEVKPSKLYAFQAMSEGEEELEDIEDLDEEKILKLFKQEGHMQKEKVDELEVKLYINIECENSLYILTKENCFRTFCYKLMSNPWWERIIIILIILSSMKLAIDTYGQDEPEDSQFQITSSNIDSVFNWAFICELLVKVFAMGLIMDSGSYLREAWNQLDFVIVFCSVLEMVLNLLGVGGDLGFIKILRMLRVLRPLRMISRSPELKMVINALLESLGSISNVLIVLCVIFLIFSIIGTNFFGGKFFYCSQDPYLLHTKNECELAGGSWELWDHNFDNAINGFVTLYVVSSLEGWPDIYLQAADIVDLNLGPQKDNNRTMAIIYFILFIVIGSFFFLNMFVGVLFMKFTEAHREQVKGFTQEELDWKEIQEMIEAAEPEFTTTNVPTNEVRKKFHDLVTSSKFENFIMLVIILNMTQMGVEHEGMTPAFIAVIEAFGAIFTVIFIVECVLKLVAFGSTYFNTAWNKFDFFVVIASIFNYMLKFLDTNAGWLSVLPQLARVFRVLRVTRILKLVGKSEGLQAIMMTIQYSISALFNVFILLLLFFFIFAVLFNFMFNTVNQGEDVIDDVKHFRLWHNSFLLVFAVTTGEDWNKVMFECGRTADSYNPCVEGINCGSPLAKPLFILLVLANTHIMLNLFILVIIQQFEKNYSNPETSNLNRFNKDSTQFMFVWKEYTQERYNCQVIKESQLSDFFKKLGEYGDKHSSLGFTDEIQEEEQKRIMLRMGIRGDNGFVHFNELLFRCMRRKYGVAKMNRINQLIELSTRYRIFQKIHENVELTNQFIHDQLVKKNNNFNPFLTKMNYKITFKTWLKHAKSIIKKRINEVKLAEAQKLGPAAYREMSLSLAEDDEKPKFENVPIEVEIEIEYTSEEETESKFGGISRGRSLAMSLHASRFIGSAAKSMRSSISPNKAKLGQSAISSGKKRTDHLSLFQERMKAKLLQTMKKKSVKDQHLLATPFSGNKSDGRIIGKNGISSFAGTPINKKE